MKLLLILNKIMKTRLLKKTRKRFKIFRVDKLGNHPDERVKEFSILNQLPFYIIIDNKKSTFTCYNYEASARLDIIRRLRLENPSLGNDKDCYTLIFGN